MKEFLEAVRILHECFDFYDEVIKVYQGRKTDGIYFKVNYNQCLVTLKKKTILLAKKCNKYIFLFSLLDHICLGICWGGLGRKHVAHLSKVYLG